MTINTVRQQTKEAAQSTKAAMIDFAQRLIRTYSPSGQEREIAQIIQQEMDSLGFDETWVDEAGNVIGKLNGGSAPPVLLNGHMDHVDPGPPEGWPYPPFSAQIVDGELWGRGSVDMKGPVACMIYAISLLKQIDLKPPGDVYMTVPVMEEVGGMGTKHLASRVKAAVAICGEPSHNTLRRGHRGRVEMELTFKGKSAHASAPHLAVNPHFDMAHFLSNFSALQFDHDEALGSSTVMPTLYRTDQSSSNVNPSEVSLILDWRNVPSEPWEEIVAQVQNLADRCLAERESKAEASVRVVTKRLRTYTGLPVEHFTFPSFLLPEDNIFLQTAHRTLTQLFGRDDGVDVWRFATDGGHLMAAGIPTVGFGPGNELLAHTNKERMDLAQLEEALVAYVALIVDLAEAAR